MMQTILTTYAPCPKCKSATRVTTLHLELDDDGQELEHVTDELLPPHSCDRMNALRREEWPVSQWF